MDRYALVTGASRGIGRAIALKLAGCGRNLIITADKDRRGLEETAAAAGRIYAERFGQRAASYMDCRSCLFDVSDSAAVSHFFSETDRNGIFIDVLVNNAGISCFDLVQDISDAQWNRIIGVNLTGVFNMCRGAAPQMIRAKEGSIINISSYWGIAGSSMESAYCASKGGVNAFTLSLAKELKESNIRVNAIACEFVDTQMNAHLDEEEVKEAVKAMPSGRVTGPEEIADIVISLLAPENKQTGEIIGIDG